MSAGLPIDKNNLDGRIGNLCWEVRRNLDDGARLATVLTGLTDQELGTIGYTDSGDITDLRGAGAALKKMHDLFYGLDTAAVAVDLSAYTNVLTGLQ